MRSQFPFLGTPGDLRQTNELGIQIGFPAFAKNISLGFGYSFPIKDTIDIVYAGVVFTNRVDVSNHYFFRLNYSYRFNNILEPYFSFGVAQADNYSEVGSGKVIFEAISDNPVFFHYALGLHLNITQNVFIKAEVANPYFPNIKLGAGARF